MGGAMLAAVGCGAYPDVESITKKIVKIVDTVEPQPELVAKYEEKYQKFRTLYPTMKPLFREQRAKRTCKHVYLVTAARLLI